MARRRGPRGLDETDRRLWSHVTRDVAPLPKRPADPSTAPPARPLTAGPISKPRPPKKAAPSASAHPAPPAQPSGSSLRPSRTPPAPQDPGTLDGGLQRKLRRGRIEPEASIDLHGLTQAAAHQLLREALPRHHAAGCRCLLVVTGKGSASSLARHTLHGDTISSTPERRGILRDSLPRWLADPEFRALVAAVRPAHPRHGGGGAFYVWLRRMRQKR